MKIHVMSDLHFEHMYTMDESMFWDGLEELRAKTPANVLVLAGDICQIGHRESLFKKIMARLCGMYNQVIYVPGNHEHYDTGFDGVQAFLNTLFWDPTFRNLTYLGDKPVVYYEMDGDKVTNAIRFIGDTMWFPDLNSPWAVKRCMSDFFVIKDFEPRVYVEHEKFKREVMANLKAKDVVVSHHMPLPACVDSQYAGSPLNPFFMADMSSMLREEQLPRLWIHGHTHTTVDLIHRVGNASMRVYCNPKGYPMEGANNQFWNRVAIDI